MNNNWSIYNVRMERRIFFPSVRRPYRRTNCLLFTNLPISNSNRFCFRKDMFQSKCVTLSNYYGNRSLYPPWFRRALRIFSRREDFSDRFVKRVEVSGPNRPFRCPTRFRVEINVFSWVGSPRHLRRNFVTISSRCAVSRSINSKISARSSFFQFLFCQRLFGVPRSLPLG